MSATEIRPLSEPDIAVCADLIRSLPDWFGLEESNRAYIDSLRRLPGLVAVDEEETVVGFLALETHAPGSVEITVMAVDRARHRKGIGRALIERTVAWCRDRDVRWLHVKTRGPATYDDDYERTRRFYRAVGFDDLYESLTEWGPEDAALVLVMHLDERAIKGA